MGLFSGPGLTPSLKGNATNVIELAAGEVYTLLNAGWYYVKTGPYTTIQQFDPILGIWQTIGGGGTSGDEGYVYSDGVNYRFANQTGCVIGALLTNGGSSYTSAPTVTASAGSSLWRAIVGGAVNTSVTVSAAGTGYTYPPIVVFSAPPAGGIQADGYCTLSGSTVSTVTVTDQGAGYASPPTISFINDPREGVNNVAQGSGAAAVATLTGANTITGLLCIDHGTGTQTSLPTLSFSGGGGSSAAATAIMCWTITAYNVSATTAGSGYFTPVIVSAYDNFPGTSPAYTNVTTQSKLLKTRNAFIIGAVSGTALTTVGQTVKDGGIYSAVPIAYVASASVAGTASSQAILLSPTMGGANDFVRFTPV